MPARCPMSVPTSLRSPCLTCKARLSAGSASPPRRPQCQGPPALNTPVRPASLRLSTTSDASLFDGPLACPAPASSTGSTPPTPASWEWTPHVCPGAPIPDAGPAHLHPYTRTPTPDVWPVSTPPDATVRLPAPDAGMPATLSARFQCGAAKRPQRHLVCDPSGRWQWRSKHSQQ